MLAILQSLAEAAQTPSTYTQQCGARDVTADTQRLYMIRVPLGRAGVVREWMMTACEVLHWCPHTSHVLRVGSQLPMGMG